MSDFSAVFVKKPFEKGKKKKKALEKHAYTFCIMETSFSFLFDDIVTPYQDSTESQTTRGTGIYAYSKTIFSSFVEDIFFPFAIRSFQKST